MRVGEIGGTFSSTTEITFSKKTNFLDYDLIVVDYYTLLKQARELTGLIIKEIKAELDEYIRLRKVPIVYHNISENQMYLKSEGGYNKQPMSFSSLAPVPDVKFISKDGFRLEIVSSTPFSTFLNKYQSNFKYNAVITGTGLKSILQTPFSKMCIAGYDEKSVILPSIKIAAATQEAAFFKELLECMHQVKNVNENELPEWSKKYYLPNEKDTVEAIDTMKKSIEKLEQELLNKELLLGDLRQDKQLFTATGAELENTVKRIFTEMGFTTIEAEDRRDDLILNHGDTTFIFEIKGLSKSAAEKNAAQLEKWLSEFRINKEGIAKGILLVNTFRNDPLNERTGDSFPHQMIPFSTKRDHCLMTTIDLMILYFKFKAHQLSTEDVSALLLSTNGVLKLAEKWSDYIINEHGAETSASTLMATLAHT